MLDTSALLAALPYDSVMMLDPERRVLHVGGKDPDALSGACVGERVPRALAEVIGASLTDAFAGVGREEDVRPGGRTFLQQLVPVFARGDAGTSAAVRAAVPTAGPAAVPAAAPAAAPAAGPAAAPVAVLVLWRDVAAVRAEEAKLRESELQLRLTVDNAPIGEALVELDGRWRRVNPALTQLIGYTEAELLRTTFQDITHPDDLALDLDLLRQLVAGDIDSYQMEKRYFTAAGSTVWVLLCVSLVRADGGEPLYFVSQILDVTGRKAQEASLRDLTAMLAHDLRLPTTVISGYAELLLSDDESLTPAGRRGVVARLARAAGTLEELLENSLTASALDAGGLTPMPQTVDLGLVVREVVGAIPHPGVSIDLALVGGARAWVDRQHLQRALTNLVSNAVKYGGGRVSIEVEEYESRVRIRVVDRGNGVAPEFVPRLFERFTRSDAARSGPQRGSGLGLHIVRDLIHLNEGAVAYLATPGGGATFVLEVPSASAAGSNRQASIIEGPTTG